MRFTTKTEYGLVCLVHIARNSSNQPVNIKQILKKEKLSLTYIEKILQNLRFANILTAKQGKQGGYMLARDASDITLKDIVEALEGGKS